MSERETLKPCPFCGNGPSGDCYYADQGDKWGRVVCGCGAQGPDVRTQYDVSENAPWHQDADEEWNRRATPPAAGPVVWVATGNCGDGFLCREDPQTSELYAAENCIGTLNAETCDALGLAPGECKRVRLTVEGES